MSTITNHVNQLSVMVIGTSELTDDSIGAPDENKLLMFHIVVIKPF